MPDLLHPVIVQKPEIKLAGLASYDAFFEDKQSIPKLWDAFIPYIDKIPNRSHPEVCFGLELYASDFMETKRWTYMPAVEVKNFSEIPSFLVCKILPEMTYAVFTHKGIIGKISETFHQIYSGWLHQNGEYTLAAGYDFEYYDQRYKGGTGEDSETDIYLPVVKK